jgi:hypothetical protein
MRQNCACCGEIAAKCSMHASAARVRSAVEAHLGTMTCIAMMTSYSRNMARSSRVLADGVDRASVWLAQAQTEWQAYKRLSVAKGI